MPGSSFFDFAQDPFTPPIIAQGARVVLPAPGRALGLVLDGSLTPTLGGVKLRLADKSARSPFRTSYAQPGASGHFIARVGTATDIMEEIDGRVSAVYGFESDVLLVGMPDFRLVEFAFRDPPTVALLRHVDGSTFGVSYWRDQGHPAGYSQVGSEDLIPGGSLNRVQTATGVAVTNRFGSLDIRFRRAWQQAWGTPVETSVVGAAVQDALDVAAPVLRFGQSVAVVALAVGALILWLYSKKK